MLVLATSQGVFMQGYAAGGKPPESCFVLWGPDAKNVWYTIIAWGELATVLRELITENLQHGFGYVALSGPRHQHPVKNDMYEAMAFKAEAGCCSTLLNVSWCFTTAKVHERRHLIGASGGSSNI